MRDIRDGLLQLVYALANEQQNAQGYCVIADSRLTSDRLATELRQFRSIMQPSLASRIHLLHGASDGTLGDAMQRESPQFRDWLRSLLRQESAGTHRPGLAQRQIVVAALAQLRLRNAEPVTIKRLQEACDVSYPTVAAALKDLATKGMLEPSAERGVRLRRLSVDQWLELAREHAGKRTVIHFNDPTGLASPASLAKRLWKLQGLGKLPDSVRVGGVMGASHYFPEIDVTAAPRLDLSIEREALEVVQMLDAGLVERTDPQRKAILAVHLTREPKVESSGSDTRPSKWASELECLADLVEMGLSHQATDMAYHLNHVPVAMAPATS